MVIEVTLRTGSRFKNGEERYMGKFTIELYSFAFYFVFQLKDIHSLVFIKFLCYFFFINKA